MDGAPSPRPGAHPTGEGLGALPGLELVCKKQLSRARAHGACTVCTGVRARGLVEGVEHPVSEWTGPPPEWGQMGIGSQGSGAGESEPRGLCKEVPR